MQNVTINICTACVNSCPGCFTKNTNKYMSLEDFQTIIDKLPKNITSLVLTGGEPCMHPKLVPMAKYASDNLIAPIIFTSGVILKDWLDLKPFIASVHLTVHAPGKRDEAWKQKYGSFQIVRQNLERVKELGIPLAIHYTVGKDNQDCLKEMVELAKEYGATLDILRLLPFTSEIRPLALSDDQWTFFCEQASKYDNVRIMFPERPCHVSIIVKIKSAFSCKRKEECTAGVARIAIDTFGGVSPCIYYPTNPPIANILHDSFNNVERKLVEWRKLQGKETRCLAMLKLRG